MQPKQLLELGFDAACGDAAFVASDSRLEGVDSFVALFDLILVAFDWTLVVIDSTFAVSGSKFAVVDSRFGGVGLIVVAFDSTLDVFDGPLLPVRLAQCQICDGGVLVRLGRLLILIDRVGTLIKHDYLVFLCSNHFLMQLTEALRISF